MISRTDLLKKINWIITETLNIIFQVALISYLFFYSIERIKTGFVSDYFQLNIFLIITIVSGILTALLKDKERDHEDHSQIKMPGLKLYLFIFVLGVMVALIIYERTKQVGWLSYVVSGVTGLIMIILSILIISDNSNESDNN